MLTPDDVLNQRFTPTKFREGYDQREVDDFLDRVIRSLAGTSSGPGLTSTETHNWRFTPAKFRDGYDQAEVDAFLDRVVQTLSARESAAAPAPAQDPGNHPAPAAPAHALGLRDVTSKLQFAAIEAQGSDALLVRLPDGSTARVLDISADGQGVTLLTG